MPARFTTAAGHDSCHSVLPEVVATAERLAVVDEVLVMRRGAALALAAEQARTYSCEEAAGFWAVQRWLHTAVPQYRDDLIAIAGLACPLMPAQQPRQLRRSAPAAALPVPA
ncbi:hypothetical protein OIU91_07615 [Streptomyces sp. NBC_01456]|uniref:hypothetical protein n=1 Tax=unclassified Streptomyces TaxID=2593676 RepID=UPI002E37C079|nr:MULTISPECIES: hypothetical protein [unclassified Streptomyces]